MSRPSFFGIIAFWGLGFVSAGHCGDASLVWTGSSADAVYQSMLKNNSGIGVVRKRQGGRGVLVRSARNKNYVEVRHETGKIWLSLRVPFQANGSSIDSNLLVTQALSLSDCDLVKTIVDLTKSTPEASVHFNSKPVGNIKSDGRFYYESEGVCRNSSVDILATRSGCKDFAAAFKAENNPHTFIGCAALDCPK